MNTKASPKDMKNVRRICENIINALEHEMPFNALTALIEIIAILISSSELIKEDKELCIDGIINQLKLRVEHHITKGTNLK